jgi:hypothetical protein
MKRSLALAAATLLASGLASAGHCPSDVKAIDAAIKAGKVDAKKKDEVMKLRDSGEAAHKKGDHAGALKDLHKAMDLAGLKHDEGKGGGKKEAGSKN